MIIIYSYSLYKLIRGWKISEIFCRYKMYVKEYEQMASFHQFIRIGQLGPCSRDFFIMYYVHVCTKDNSDSTVSHVCYVNRNIQITQKDCFTVYYVNKTTQDCDERLLYSVLCTYWSQPWDNSDLIERLLYF